MVEASLHQSFGSLHSLAACPAKRGANWISSVSLGRGREERAGVELHKECLQPNSSALIKHFDQHTQTSVYYSIFQYTIWLHSIAEQYSIWVLSMALDGDYVCGCTNNQVDSHILLQVFFRCRRTSQHWWHKSHPSPVASFPGHTGTRLLVRGAALQSRRITPHTSQVNITH